MQICNLLNPHIYKCWWLCSKNGKKKNKGERRAAVLKVQKLAGKNLEIVRGDEDVNGAGVVIKRKPRHIRHYAVTAICKVSELECVDFRFVWWTVDK